MLIPIDNTTAIVAAVEASKTVIGAPLGTFLALAIVIIVVLVFVLIIVLKILHKKIQERNRIADILALQPIGT